jgi:uncharacterized membrane protein YraQ (UPF0718 family)
MKLDFGSRLMPLLAVGISLYIAIARRELIGRILEQLRNQVHTTAITLPFGFLIAAFLSTILPSELIARFIGSESGVAGVLLASLLGGFVPSWPAVSFPIALTMWTAGAGPTQMVAFLTAWSLFAFHRALSYEPQFM